MKIIKCPQCKSKRVIRKKIIKNYIKGFDKWNYICIKCEMIFDKYVEINKEKRSE